jgi:EAL domain-containing protein (putative c-di-GMP-specific phosphodiesterase class I)/ActR/RegA family two-component response regulator
MSTLRAMPPPPSEPSRRRGRILLVDDDECLRRAYGILLRRSGFLVDEADSGRGAREQLARSRFDMVISDIGLPDTTGLELLRSVRMLDADVPVMLMTGGADLPTAIEAVEVGALHYLLKPVDRAVLCAAAEDGLRARESARLGSQARAHYALHATEREARRELGEQLDRAVPSIRMAFQPIVRLSTRETLAYEALVRPQIDELSSPLKLFHAAERTERLHEVGRAIRASVARSLWTAERRVQVYVNLHPRDLFDDSLFEESAPLSAFAPQVTFELTERESLHDVTDLRARIDVLQSLGFRIAIDDLGAGYADLSSLTELRPDVVKLDMSFTRGIAADATKQMLVRSMRSLCDEIGTTFVIEGVETTEELERLHELGCDVFQGRLFAVPEAAFPAVEWGGIPVW